jgi:hypothetical protein
VKNLTPDQLQWVERRYADVLAYDPAGFIWDALSAQVQSMPPAELGERLAEMNDDDGGPIYALCSAQGTACLETVLTAAEYADPETRARTETAFCQGRPDDPLPGTWTDVSDNEACQ